MAGWIGETVYQDVKRLPPTQRIVCDGCRFRQESYDRLRASSPRPEPSREDDWVEQFRELLLQAVSEQLRSETAVVISTGGGLDSSALASLCVRTCASSYRISFLIPECIH